MKNFLFYTIIVVCLINLARMAVYLISSDVYALRQDRLVKSRRRWHLPTISIIIPAHNEELTILRALNSVVTSDYPASKLQIIISNDGSTDRTAVVVRSFMKQHSTHTIALLNRRNRGKAAALNYALENYATGSLVMCLDSDSYLDALALRNAAQHFKDRRIIALSSNVNIIEDGTLLSLIQRIEYLICYQMKKGQALLRIEYIVGGIGSMFRMSTLRKVGFYDTNTMTEDIDLTMKLLAHKTQRQRIAYAADSIAFTEAAHSFTELRVQRYRWKYGRAQTFLKHSELFFSRNTRHAKRLSWFMLPFSLVQDAMFLVEPIILIYFIFITIRYASPQVLLNAIIVISLYLLFNIWSSIQLTRKQRARLSAYVPLMYFLLYILAAAEYYALIKSLLLAKGLSSSTAQQHTTWKSPTRRALLSEPIS